MAEAVDAVLNRLAKWRSIFAGWQLGTRSASDPECQAVRDHREATIMLRAELNAITALLLRDEYILRSEFERQLIEEANALQAMYEERFPGMRAEDHGMVMDKRAAETMKGWRP